jgi:hypothetical protein
MFYSVKLRNFIYEFTPLGKSDKEVQKYLEDLISDEEMARYRSSLSQYRSMKVLESGTKALFYASIITSAAAAIGFQELMIIQKFASYLGTTAIFVLFAVASYLTMVKREAYHVQREILIAKAANA